MQALWERFIEFRHILWEGVLETLYMTSIAVVFAYAIGVPLGVLLVVLRKGGLMPNRPIHVVLSFAINTLRSIPFIILINALIPFSRFVVNSGIGNNAAIVALVVGSFAFVARMVETAISEVDEGVIDAAKAMGATKLQIICKVMLPESVPSLVRGFSITTIMIISFSAMAGALAAGGLGQIAIRYGHLRFMGDVMLLTIITIVIMVTIIQFGFNLLASKIDRRVQK